MSSRYRLRLTAAGVPWALGFDLLVLGLVTFLALDRPVAFGLGPGQSKVMADLATRLYGPLAGYLIALSGGLTLLDGLVRSPLPTTRWDVAASLGIMASQAVILAVPPWWLVRWGIIGVHGWSTVVTRLAVASATAAGMAHLAALPLGGSGTPRPSWPEAQGRFTMMAALLTVVWWNVS